MLIMKLSNHGGRNLDTSPPALLTLLELRHYNPNVFTQTEVYIDGGITRGTDILKALCLGARGVLIGRPFLYALSYGEEGVSHLIDCESKYLKDVISGSFADLISSAPSRTGECDEIGWNYTHIAGAPGFG